MAYCSAGRPKASQPIGCKTWRVAGVWHSGGAGRRDGRREPFPPGSTREKSAAGPSVAAIWVQSDGTDIVCAQQTWGGNMAQSARSGNGVVSAKWRNVQQFSLCAPRRLPIGDTADYQSALHAGLQGI